MSCACEQALSEEWSEMVAHSTDNCRFLWRSASKEATFVGDTSVTLPNGTASATVSLSSPISPPRGVAPRVVSL